MSRHLRDLDVHAKRAVLELAAQSHEELQGTFYLSDLLADAGATTYLQLRAFNDMVEAIQLRATLMPGSSDIPGGYESRAEADVRVGEYDEAIDGYLLELVPDAKAAAA